MSQAAPNNTGTAGTGPRSEWHAVIVGLGAIGSHLASLVTRSQDVAEITLVDDDRYEPTNLSGQAIDAADLGPKVDVQARHLRQIKPALRIHPIRARIEDVPMGRLRADAILTGLDSRSARRSVNRVARRLGIPWIDAAVDAAGLLARVIVYLPGRNAPCLECSWDETDYALLEQEYPCRRAEGTAPTNAPAGLGALAAAMVALEWGKLTGGDREHLLAGREVFADLRNHVHQVTAYRRRRDCKFDHRTWSVERLDDPPSRVTVGRLMRLAAGAGGSPADCRLRLEGHSFVRGLVCPECGTQAARTLHLARRIPPAQRRCPGCGQPMVARGFDMLDELALATLEPRERRRALSDLGFRPGDIVTVEGPTGERHWELGKMPGGPEPAAAARVPSLVEETYHA